MSYWIIESRLTSQSSPIDNKFIAIDPKKITKDQPPIEVLSPNEVSVKIQALDKQADLALLSHLIHLY
ncbi:hypothetical protein [Xanthocytophaga agilis]|uniref:Uncharacterized protein n=1 Tax=Xanthocytophaga agilis TaxID=3048010 RepID=A0AAE3UIQ9_9BACT|nr:hypothetical protein [Xanthocytophaga agilis]